MFDHMDGIMWLLALKKTPRKEDLYLAVKLARQKLSKYHSEVTPMTSMLLISAHVVDPFHKLESFSKWDNGMDINPEDQHSSTTQYQEAFPMYVENEYSANYRCMRVIELKSVPSNNLFLSGMASASIESSFDPYDLSGDDEEYWTPTKEAVMAPRQCGCAAHLLTAARLYLNSPPELPKSCG